MTERWEFVPPAADEDEGPSGPPWSAIALVVGVLLLAAIGWGLLGRLIDGGKPPVPPPSPELTEEAQAAEAAARRRAAASEREAQLQTMVPGPLIAVQPSPEDFAQPAADAAPTDEPLPVPADTPEALRKAIFDTLDRLVADLPKLPEPQGLLAIAHRRFGASDEAEKCWKRAVELDPAFEKVAAEQQAAPPDPVDPNDLEKMRFVAAYFHLTAGNIYARHGRLGKSERLWRLATKIHPGEVDARLRLVEMYQQRERPAEALKLLEELRAIDPKNVLYCVNVGAMQADLGNFEAAEAAFREATEIAPEDSMGHSALAEFYLRVRQNPLEARASAQRAVDRQPAVRTYLLLATACRLAGDIPAAKAAVERAIQLEPASPELKQLLVEIEKPLEQGPSTAPAGP